MTTSWWRAVLGECTKFDSSRFNQWALPDGQSGVDGNMKCRSGLVPIRLAFMKENDRLLLTGVEARFPEKVAKVLVTPDEAEAFTKAMVAKLDDGGIPAFHSAVLGAAAADDVAPPAVINAITEKIGKVSRWEVVDRKPTLTASQETFFLWHGEGTPVQVILDVVKLDGVLRVSGLRWRAAPEAMKH
jgi:hypothetical protein